MFRIVLKSAAVFAIVAFGYVASAQQSAVVQPPVAAAQPAAQPGVPATTSPVAAASESESRLLKATATGMRELSPWSMFMRGLVEGDGEQQRQDPDGDVVEGGIHTQGPGCSSSCQRSTGRPGPG